MTNNLTGTDRVKRGMAEMQKGGVIMDVINAEQARIAEAAGAVAVMALRTCTIRYSCSWRGCTYGRSTHHGRSNGSSNYSSNGKSSYWSYYRSYEF